MGYALSFQMLKYSLAIMWCMRGVLVGIVMLVLGIAIAGMVSYSNGSAGAITVDGAVCCAASLETQSSTGFFQGQSEVQTIYCDATQSMELCCLYNMTEELGGRVKLDGAHPGICGNQRFG